MKDDFQPDDGGNIVVSVIQLSMWYFSRDMKTVSKAAVMRDAVYSHVTL